MKIYLRPTVTWIIAVTVLILFFIANFGVVDSIDEVTQTRILHDLANINTALTHYREDTGQYPAHLGELTDYFSVIPTDPWGNGYLYTKTILISLNARIQPALLNIENQTDYTFPTLLAAVLNGFCTWLYDVWWCATTTTARWIFGMGN